MKRISDKVEGENKKKNHIAVNKAGNNKNLLPENIKVILI